MKNNKDRLFELFERLNPVNINEDIEYGDVEAINNLKTPALKKAQRRVDSHGEFKEAFDNWFGSLGVSGEYAHKFNSITAINDIREIFEKYGIKP